MEKKSKHIPDAVFNSLSKDEQKRVLDAEASFNGKTVKLEPKNNLTVAQAAEILKNGGKI